MTDASDHAAPAKDQVARDQEEDLRRLGITTVQSTAFEWAGYRYSNASDAIAAAKRGKT